jgi:hypothetical protein
MKNMIRQQTSAIAIRMSSVLSSGSFFREMLVVDVRHEASPDCEADVRRQPRHLA